MARQRLTYEITLTLIGGETEQSETLPIVRVHGVLYQPDIRRRSEGKSISIAKRTTCVTNFLPKVECAKSVATNGRTGVGGVETRNGDRGAPSCRRRPSDTASRAQCRIVAWPPPALRLVSVYSVAAVALLIFSSSLLRRSFCHLVGRLSCRAYRPLNAPSTSMRHRLPFSLFSFVGVVSAVVTSWESLCTKQVLHQ